MIIEIPGSVPPSAAFFDDLETIVAKLCLTSDIVLIAGDMNVRLDRPADPHTVSFNQVLSNFDLHQHVLVSTHSLGGTLDVVITRDDVPIAKLSVEFVPFSDHMLVKWSLSFEKPAIVLRTIKSRNWKMFDRELFCSDISDRFPDTLSAPTYAASIGDVDELTEFYNDTIAALLDKHAPPTDVTYRERRSNEWFDDACRDARARVRYLERQYQRTDSDADQATWRKSLAALHTLFNAKRTDATMRSIREAQGDSKNLWRELDRTMGTVDTRFEYVHSANDFADFFANKISTIRMETMHAPAPVYAAAAPAFLPELACVQPAQVVELIRLAPSKHSDLDPLPTWLLKQCSQALAPYLTALFNLSIVTATFPACMKRATVVPLLKKDNLNADDIKNYRPVSNLSFISKLLEKIISEQITHFLEDNEMLPDRQSAYRAGHSCETALLRIHSDMIAVADAGHISLIAMLDLSAAFDCVDHEI